MPKGTVASPDPREKPVSRTRQALPPLELSEARREKRGRRAVQASVTLVTKVIVDSQDLQGLLELQVLQLRWCGWEMVLSCNRWLDLKGLLGFQVRMGLQDPRGQTENQEIQARMGKLANGVLEGLLGARAAQEPKDRRESVERASLGLGALQDYLALQGPAVGTDLHLWTWRDLGLQTWTNGVPVGPQDHQGLLVFLGHQWPLMAMVQ